LKRERERERERDVDRQTETERDISLFHCVHVQFERQRNAECL